LLGGLLLTVLLVWRGASSAQRCALIGVFLLAMTLLTPLQSHWWPQVEVPVLQKVESVAGPMLAKSVLAKSVLAEPQPVPVSKGDWKPQAALRAETPKDALPMILLTIWLVGAALLLGRLAVGAWLWRRLWASAEIHEQTAECELRVSKRTAVPMAAGKQVLMPAEWLKWSAEDQWAALEHERAHARHRDGLTRCLAAVATALHWPSPLVWVVERRLRLAQEQRCDETVLASGVDSAAYGRLLMRCAQTVNGGSLWLSPAVASMARPSQLAERIEHIASGVKATRPARWWHVVAPLLLVLAGLQAMHLRLVAQEVPSKASSVKAQPLLAEPTPALTTPEVDSTLTVWRVGSPHAGDTPPASVPSDLEIAAKNLGYSFQVRSFPAQGFHVTFSEAVAANSAPDILVIDNHGILEGVTTNLGTFTGIATKREVRKSLLFVMKSFETLGDGWQLLNVSSRNHKGAKKLAMREPTLQALLPEGVSNLKPDEVTEVSALGIRVFEDYVKGDGTDLQRLSDPQASHSGPQRLGSAATRVKLGPVKVQGVVGNSRLAFALVTAVGELSELDSSGQSEVAAGWLTRMMILRKTNGEWKLLSNSETGPVSVWQNLFSKEWQNILTQMTQRDDGGNASIKAPDLLAPADGALSASRFQPPDIEWADVGNSAIGCVVEAQFDGGGGRWSDSYFIAVARGENSANGSHKMKAAFGVGAQPHRWRVWAVARSGDVGISKWRTLTFTK
jgi:beta-lactamase regulating signal transducer with metallopeptidase domain